MPAAATGALACYVFQRWLRDADWSGTAALGAALGLALLTKFTLLILLPTFLLLVVGRGISSRRRSWRSAAQLATAYVFALVLINLGYGFEESFRPLCEFQFVSGDFAGFRAGFDGRPQFGNRFAGSWCGGLPVPVPANYLMGIDVQRRDFELDSKSFLLGEWRDHGWWYYYLVGLLFKEPLGYLLLLGTAFALPLVRRSWRPSFAELVPIACFVAVIGFVSSHTGFTHHLRYLLPAFPAGVVTACRVFADGRPRRIQFVVGGCLCWAVAAGLWSWPHGQSYFNEAAGGSRGGYRLLHPNNVDWGKTCWT